MNSLKQRKTDILFKKAEKEADIGMYTLSSFPLVAAAAFAFTPYGSLQQNAMILAPLALGIGYIAASARSVNASKAARKAPSPS